MEFRVLGPLEAYDDRGRPLGLGGTKQRALLATLLLHANRVVSVDRLIDDLWGDHPPETAQNTLQAFVSRLRKALEQDGLPRVLHTRPPGYLLAVEPDRLDLARFEQLLAQGERALADGDAPGASALLHEALDLWRGPPLDDVAHEPFALVAIRRLDELRLTALEQRLEADLALGRHGDLVAELAALVREHPLRERLRGQQLLALYRSGRQAEALDAYQDARRTLVDELGIDPSPALQQLEKAILRQDPALDLAPAPRPAAPALPPVPAPLSAERSLLVVPGADEALDGLLAVAEPLARSSPPRELVVARLVEPGRADELARATASLHARRDALVRQGVAARVAAFTSTARGRDVVRLATRQEVELVLLDCDRTDIAAGLAHGELGAVLAEAPSDVAVLVAPATPAATTAAAVLVPFGGADHDWAALELAAWVAHATGAPLRLLGSAGRPDADERDASWLLANASLVVQHVAGVPTEPVLVPPGADGVLDAAAGGGLLVVGLAETWRQDGLGAVRDEIAQRSPVPVLLVRRGPRPGGLAPRETLTRFTWSLAGTPEGVRR